MISVKAAEPQDATAAVNCYSCFTQFMINCVQSANATFDRRAKGQVTSLALDSGCLPPTILFVSLVCNNPCFQFHSLQQHTRATYLFVYAAVLSTCISISHS